MVELVSRSSLPLKVFERPPDLPPHRESRCDLVANRASRCQNHLFRLRSDASKASRASRKHTRLHNSDGSPTDDRTTSTWRDLRSTSTLVYPRPFKPSSRTLYDSSTTMGAYDNGFGVDLITTWFCSLLAGVGLTQAVRYFAKFPNDILFKKGLVGVVLFLLFLEVAMECASSYTSVVTDWGNPTAFTIVIWPYAGAILCTSVIAFIVDQFLIHRFYGLSKNIWVAIILSLFNLVSFVMGLIIVQFFASKVGSTISLAELHDTVTPVTTALSTMSVVTDVTIAASLVWTLRGMKTSFKNTNQLIQHIVAISIQNGCTTSAVAIAGMVAQLVAPATRIDDFFFGLLGPLYLLTVLSNLTLRESAPPSSGWSSSGEIGGSRNNQLPFGGVHVRRSVTTTGGTSTDFGAAYDDTTVRGTSDDVEAGRKEFEDASSADQNAEKIQFRAN